jgi:uncharacterized membrane protein
MIERAIMKKTVQRIGRYLHDHPRMDIIFVAVALVIFGGLAFWNIAGPSIWFDEAFGAFLIQYNFIDIARYTATDVHPPLFYWLLKIWTFFFGTTELGLRSMSVFFGAVAAVFGYLLVRRQFGRKAAMVGLFILVLSPLFIRYSQEARMYTLAAAIVMAATYVLVRALESKGRKLWALYGVLVSLGMWTHYFTILAWLVHWVWRYILIRQDGFKGKALIRKFFDKKWLTAYIVAIGLFLPWLPAMAVQMIIVQATGFWIAPVGVDTVTSYFGTLVFFLEHNQVTGWMAASLLAFGILLTYLTVRNYKQGNKTFKRRYLLLLSLAAVPPLLLFIVSLPPLTSSFVERYVLPTAVASAFFVGVTLVYGLSKIGIWKQIAVYAVIGAMLVVGIGNMYFYGNYNKNSLTGIETKQLVKQVIEKSDPGQPIIVNSPWVFYEAIFYNSDEHPIYFIDADVEYKFGSLDMLKYNDTHKIKDLDAFIKEHPKVWYIGYSDGPIGPRQSSWTKIDETSVTNHVDGKTVYRGSEFTTSTR